MTGTGAWLAAALGLPFAMLLACLSPSVLARMPALLAFAAAPALAAGSLAGDGALVLPRALLGLSLSLDRPAAVLLGVAALLWAIAGLYAKGFLRTQPNRERFAVWWLATLTGSLGVFIAADLVTFYLLFSMVSLAAYGLIIHDRTPAARHAGAVYLALALLGECLLLMSFVLLAAAIPGHSLLIRDAVAALPASPSRDLTITLLFLGFGLKMGLVPLHVWMPIAHPAAPIPASAVLSGIIVKAGVIGLIRFLPFQTALPDWGGALAVAGLVSAFYGVAVGVTQSNPKTVLAYSSVSQMGLIATVLGMGLSNGNETIALPVALYAANHMLVKGALFLGVGAAQATGAGYARSVMPTMALLALSLSGLPITGGALAKLVVKGSLGSGVEGTLATVSAAGSTLLMCHFLIRLRQQLSPQGGTAPPQVMVPWAVSALACVVVPWTLYLAVGNGTVAEALAPKALWAASWPILLGGTLALVLRRWEGRLPRIPAGDIEVPAEDVARSLADVLGKTVERMDGLLLQWPTAGALLITLVMILGAAMLFAS